MELKVDQDAIAEMAAEKIADRIYCVVDMKAKADEALSAALETAMNTAIPPVYYFTLGAYDNG
jgi:hypothetical protein